MRKITIIDVARKAGVSPTTVSRVLNNDTRKHMREETKQRVLRVIKQLDYTPNKYARFMKKRKSGVIGVLIPDISDQFFSLMVRGIENIAYQNDYSVVICDAENSLEKEKKYIRVLQKEIVEGVILTSSSIENEKVKKLIKERIPVILADRKLKNGDLPYVGSDGVKDSHTLTKCLIDLGYTEIGFLKGPSEVATATERFEGYVRAMEQNRLIINENYLKQGDYTFQSGYLAGKEFVNFTRLPQAIIAANDLMAIGITRALEEKGLRIPQDIGVAGFGNIPLSSLVKPKLTTIEIPAYDIGREATLILLSHIKRKRKRIKTKIIDTKLIKGESCKPVK